MTSESNGELPENLTDDEKKQRLFLSQRRLLDTFLANGAISQAQYDKSLSGLIEKMCIDPDAL